LTIHYFRFCPLASAQCCYAPLQNNTREPLMGALTDFLKLPPFHRPSLCVLQNVKKILCKRVAAAHTKQTITADVSFIMQEDIPSPLHVYFGFGGGCDCDGETSAL
jgi:hypothetical protein